MFRLIKLAMYALIGYVLYELYQGMTSEPAGAGQRGGAAAGRRQMAGSTRQRGFRDQTMTGAGEGRTEQTLNPDGGSIPHRVGRGVTTS